MERVRILIVEDEPLIAEDLSSMLEDLGHAVSGRVHSAQAALAAVASERPDVVMLDIRLGDGADGVDVAAALQRMEVPFLYVTSHTDPGTLARVGATRPAGFIIKPFDEEDVRTQMAIALARLNPGATRPDDLFVRDRGRLVRVPLDEVVYAEADDNYVTLHTDRQRHVMVGTLSALQERLGDDHFIRVHRSYIVNARRVTALEEGQVCLGAVRVPVGRTHRGAVRLRLGLA